MATVRLTREIRSSIENRINSKFHGQTDIMQNTLSKTFGDRAYAYALRKTRKDMDKLPANYFPQAKNIRTVLQHFELPDIEAVLQFTTPKSIPYTMYQDYRTSLICDNSQLYDEYKIIHDKIQIVEAEQLNVRTAIINSLQNFTTLKKFLAVMPEAEMFIPDRYLTIHHKSNPKKPPADKLPNKSEGLTHEQRIIMAKAKMLGA